MVRLVWEVGAGFVSWRLRLGARFIGELILTYFEVDWTVGCWRLVGETRWLEIG